MGMHRELVQSAKIHTTACDGDAAALILHSVLCGSGQLPPNLERDHNYCILVQPTSKLDSRTVIDRLTPDTPQGVSTPSLEDWLINLSQQERDGYFYFCIELPPFSMANSEKVGALLRLICESTITSTYRRIYAISPQLCNWRSLPFDGFVQAELNNSQHAGANFFKFAVGFISPFVGACIDPNEFQEFLFEPENAAILVDAEWHEGATPSLRATANSLETIKKSRVIVAVSAGSPLSYKTSRALRSHLTKVVAPYAEFVHTMDNCGIVRASEAPEAGHALQLHLLCARSIESHRASLNDD